MKMTMELDDQLVQKVEACAAEQGKTLVILIERILSDYVQSHGESKSAIALLTKSGRPVPGVDIDDRTALYDRMDARD